MQRAFDSVSHEPLSVKRCTTVATHASNFASYTTDPSTPRGSFIHTIWVERQNLLEHCTTNLVLESLQKFIFHIIHNVQLSKFNKPTWIFSTFSPPLRFMFSSLTSLHARNHHIPVSYPSRRVCNSFPIATAISFFIPAIWAELVAQIQLRRLVYARDPNNMALVSGFLLLRTFKIVRSSLCLSSPFFSSFIIGISLLSRENRFRWDSWLVPLVQSPPSFLFSQKWC